MAVTLLMFYIKFWSSILCPYEKKKKCYLLYENICRKAFLCCSYFTTLHFNVKMSVHMTHHSVFMHCCQKLRATFTCSYEVWILDVCIIFKVIKYIFPELDFLQQRVFIVSRVGWQGLHYHWQKRQILKYIWNVWVLEIS